MKTLAGPTPLAEVRDYTLAERSGKMGKAIAAAAALVTIYAGYVLWMVFVVEILTETAWSRSRQDVPVRDLCESGYASFGNTKERSPYQSRLRVDLRDARDRSAGR